MIETEIKAKISDECLKPEDKIVMDLRGKAMALGFFPFKQVEITDYYYDNGNLYSQGKSLRIRQYGDEPRGEKYLCYKGPKIEGKSREELDINVDENGVKIFNMLPKIGFSLTAAVIKTRVKAKHNDIEICIDMVNNLGTFIEIEAQAENEIRMKAMLIHITDIMQKLGYTELIDDSYLEMVQKRK